MTDTPTADVVSRQYERWRYPHPMQDVAGWLQGNWERFDPSHAHRMLWPDRDYKPDADILIAGCGTNQAAVFAFTNPDARVVAIDVSQPSLDHQQYLKDRHGLWNLELHRLPIEEVASLDRDFDLIVSTGVLHHLADSTVGMRALGERLRPDGVLGVMVYARYGRAGVEVMQSVFRDMGLSQNEESLRTVRDTLAMLPPEHPVHAYAKVARDLVDEAAVVDTFLHGRDRSFTVDDCLATVESAGLVFQSWLNKSPYYAHDLFSRSTGFHAAVQRLPEEKQWSVMERIHTLNACHFFLACRPERPVGSYVIDFAAPAFLDYVPMLQQRCGLNGAELHRPDWRVGLNPAQLPFVQLADGRRSIGEIVTAIADSGAAPRASAADLQNFAHRLFQGLYRLDFVTMGLR